MGILVFNCGSSSLKFELLEVDSQGHRKGDAIGGRFEEIGRHPRAAFWQGERRDQREAPEAASHPDAATAALDHLERTVPGAMHSVTAIAHRVVHGGSALRAPARVKGDVLAAIEKAAVFAPLHNPPALATVRAVGERLPQVPAIVVPDTAFHHTLPPRAFTYPIPSAIARRHEIRRYGFHGSGHAYMAERYAALNRRKVDELDLITLQLGAGSSVTAIKAGHSVDTSMGMTPLEGLMMETRSGDIDPAIPGFIAAREDLDAGQIDHLLNNESGLLGVCGVSADMREVAAAAAGGNRDAELAIDMFCYRARKYVGAYLAALGRADAIIFGGGIGENADWVRERILGGLAGLGIMLDSAANHGNGEERRISTPNSPIAVWVIALDEELYMARQALVLIRDTPDDQRRQ